jgi:hypothetical protein
MSAIEPAAAMVRPALSPQVFGLVLYICRGEFVRFRRRADLPATEDGKKCHFLPSAGAAVTFAQSGSEGYRWSDTRYRRRRITADTRRAHHVRGFCGLRIARCVTTATVENGRFTRLDPETTQPTGAALSQKAGQARNSSIARIGSRGRCAAADRSAIPIRPWPPCAAPGAVAQPGRQQR